MTQTTACLPAGTRRPGASAVPRAGGDHPAPEAPEPPGSHPAGRPEPARPAAEVSAELTMAARLSAVLHDANSSESVIAVLSGPVGSGLGGVLRRASGATGMPTAWLHVLPARADGSQRCLAHWAHEDGTGQQSTTAAASVAEVLDQLAEHLPPNSILVMDAFHALNPGSASALIVWSQAARQRGVRVLFGYHPALDGYGVGTLLNVPTGTHWLDLHGLRDEVVRTDLQALPGWSSPEVIDIAAAAVAGNASLLKHLRRALSAEAILDADTVATCQTIALEASSIRMVCDQGPDALALAGVVGLTSPEVDPHQGAELLGLPAAKSARLQRLLREVGMTPAHPLAAATAFEVLRHHMPVHIRRQACGHAHNLLAGLDADQGRLFALRATVGDPLTGALTLAQAAFDEAMADGEVTSAAEIAATLMTRTEDPAEVAWARAAQLRCWAISDWTQFANRAPWCDEPAVAAELPMLDASHWLAVEAPSVSKWLAFDQRTDNSEEAARLVLRAWMGSPAEADLSALDADLTESGIFSVSAPVASRLALAWLALADFDAANRWACVATFTAAEDESADCAMGHLVAAHAQLRMGEFARADEHAVNAINLFARFSAGNLGQLAELTRIHIALESGQPAGPVAPLPPGRTHPGLRAYRTYVAARADLEAGRADAAVRQFFECGRLLKRWGVLNPSLVNWAAHLVAIFRASGQVDFMRHIEDELVAGWKAWAAVEPAAAQRRSEVLGARSTEIHPDADDLDTELTLATLSPAELRVVELVVQGRSNRDAAKELFLSKRTVDTHLGNVYRKLGLGCREELVEIMHRLAPARGGRAVTCFG